MMGILGIIKLVEKKGLSIYNFVEMPRIISSILFLFFLSHAPVTFALNPDTPFDKYNHKTWTIRHGLPNNTITAIIQDSRDYMWFGTGNGLARFDGFRFKIFNKENTPGLKSNSITSLMAANDRKLWIGTHGSGVSVYNYENESFYHYSTHNGLPDNFINAIAGDSRGSIWLGTMGSGLVRFVNKKFFTITTQNGLSSNIVLSVYVDSKGGLWAGTETGLNHLGKDGKITVYSRQDGLLDDGITCLFEDSKTDLWIGSRSGISKRTKGRFTSISAAAGLSDTYVHSIREDRDGLIWVATDNGIYRINKGRIDRFTANQGLSSDSLLSLYNDSEGNLWIGTSGSGLSVLWDGKLDFYTVKDGLSSSFVKAIYGDNKGTLWIGTGGGGLNRLRAKKFKVYTKQDGLSSNYIESLCGDKEGNLWVGTNMGLNRFKNGTFTVFTRDQGLSNDSIKVLFVDSMENLWIGTYGGGVNLFKNGKFRVFDKKKGLSNNFVLCINEDIYGNIWIGTNEGLNCYKNNRFIIYRKKDGLNGDIILDIHPDRDGALWIATNGGGLNRFKQGRITRLKTAAKVSSSSIYRILDDERGNLWLSSNNGVFSVAKESLIQYAKGKLNYFKYNHFNENDGLKAAAFSGGFQPAGWKTKEGAIWLPTKKGLAMIDLEKSGFKIRDRKTEVKQKQKKNPSAASYLKVVRPLHVVIERVMVDGKAAKFKDLKNLPSGTEKIEFYFTAPSFTAPEKVKFMYRLCGTRAGLFSRACYDTGWVNIENRKSVSFQGLSSDYYTLQVKAAQDAGKWSYLNRAQQSFYINPIFFLSFWSCLITAVFFALAIIWGPRYLEWRIAKKYPLPERYKTSTLTDKKSKEMLRQLLELMEKEKLYLDPYMTLQKMAGKLNITKEEISQVINREMYMNFNNFLNKYRVNEAKIKLRDPKENRYVILKVAYDVGFNSKSSFNSAFKKFTNMSPSQYRKKFQVPSAAGHNTKKGRSH